MNLAQVTVVAISVDYNNARKVCEVIENETFDSLLDLRQYLDKQIKDDGEEELEEPLFFSLTHFMDECNNQELNIENYFISYCKILNL